MGYMGILLQYSIPKAIFYLLFGLYTGLGSLGFALLMNGLPFLGLCKDHVGPFMELLEVVRGLQA